MTVPQLVAVLDAHNRLQIESAVFMSDAVYAGVAPTVSKEGHRASQQWHKRMKGMLE